jgi:hypothetical protein
MRWLSRRRPIVSFFLPAILVTGLFASPAQAQEDSAFQTKWESGIPASVSGIVTAIYVDDFANRRAELLHYVRDEKTGKSYRIRFESQPPGELRSGQRIKLRGRAHEPEIYLSAVDGTGVTITSNAPASANYVSGDQKTLVIVANFTDSCVSCSVETINQLMFNDPSGLSVDRLYRDSSLGAISFSGTVVGPFDIPFASTDQCELGEWAGAAEERAVAAGLI